MTKSGIASKRGKQIPIILTNHPDSQQRRQTFDPPCPAFNPPVPGHLISPVTDSRGMSLDDNKELPARWSSNDWICSHDSVTHWWKYEALKYMYTILIVMRKRPQNDRQMIGLFPELCDSCAEFRVRIPESMHYLIMVLWDKPDSF